uniref:Uncharacterized protein n=1 Tax=Arundo donax TaxID=35708 RepID=A0A0A9GL35_ARUDO
MNLHRPPPTSISLNPGTFFTPLSSITFLAFFASCHRLATA